MQTLRSHYKFALTTEGRSLDALRQPLDDRARERFGLVLCFKALESAVDNGQRGIRLLSRKNQRGMDADSRCVAHHDQALRETALEELDAFLLR